MAQFQSIAATGKSIERFLNFCFDEEEPVDGSNTRAILVRTEDLDPTRSPTAIASPAISILLYRVNFNSATRGAWSAVGHQDGRAHLPLDLHFLLTPWASNAEAEHRILGRAMQCLDITPNLSGPLLDPMAHWAPGENVQVCLAELTTEDAMRTFDTLPLDYKLSVHYLARVVRIDQATAVPDTPVSTAAVGAKPEVIS